MSYFPFLPVCFDHCMKFRFFPCLRDFAAVHSWLHWPNNWLVGRLVVWMKETSALNYVLSWSRFRFVPHWIIISHWNRNLCLNAWKEWEIHKIGHQFSFNKNPHAHTHRSHHFIENFRQQWLKKRNTKQRTLNARCRQTMLWGCDFDSTRCNHFSQGVESTI